MAFLTMTPLSMETWVVVGIIAAVTLTCCAHILASLLREHDRLVKFHTSCDALRSDYDRRIREITERRPAREVAPGHAVASVDTPPVGTDADHASPNGEPSHAPTADAKAA
ncbi:MAG: hypothetical protein K2X32_13820 [Phycisphaerales bacterium]|nr:hypothetical protein [Phycisphaerales bacterium]